MLVYGFTGTQLVTQDQAMFVRNTLLRLEDPDIVITGGCIGVDAVVGKWYAEFTEAEQTVVLPYNLRKVSFWFKEFPHVKWERMPAGTSYMDRNDRMTDILTDYASKGNRVLTFAFPKELTEVVRSGTWATVRRFTNAGLPPATHPLP